MSDTDTVVSTAKLRFMRISPRKARLVADLVRGENVELALRVLDFTRKRSASANLFWMQGKIDVEYKTPLPTTQLAQ